MIKLQSLTLPEGFLNEEVREGYTVSSKMKEVWAVQLDLLQCFINVCERNNLRYFIDGGTLLGAARHQGYIPWDNDIDIAMLREDYDKLREIAKKEFRKPYLFQTEYDFASAGELRLYCNLRNVETTAIRRRRFDLRFPCNQGIYIDIFPLDGMPPAADRREFVSQLLDCKQKLDRIARKRNKNISVDIGDELSSQLAHYEQTAKRYPISPSTKKVVATTFPHREECVINLWNYKDTVSLPFEMLTVAAPCGYKDFLRHYYGTWKTPVQQFAHGDTFFDTDRPCEYWFAQDSLPKD